VRPEEPGSQVRLRSSVGEWPEFTSDGRRLVLPIQYFIGAGIGIYDTTSGECVEQIRLPSDYQMALQLRSIGERRLAVEAKHAERNGFLFLKQPPTPEWSTSLLIGDLARDQWIGRFALPDGWYSREFAAASDRRSLFVLGMPLFSRIGPMELLIFDLTSLPHPQPDKPQSWRERLWRNR